MSIDGVEMEDGLGVDPFAGAEVAAAARPPRGGRGKRIAVAFFLATTLAVTGAAGYAYWALGGTDTGAIVRIIVPEGANASQIAQELAEHGVVRSAFMFRIVARLRGFAADLKPGAYDLRQGLGVSAALTKLRDGIPLKVFRITIPEGKTLREMAAIFGAKSPLSARAFLEAVAAATRPAYVPGSAPSMEGLLFPETYTIDEKTTAAGVVDILQDTFAENVESLDLVGRAKALGVTPYEAIIIASLIEREAQGDNDRTKISSVIYNRLALGMRLQIDATVQYAIEEDTGNRKGERLTSKDNQTYDSPYNTYRIAGLPPTPIASPGLESLRAALNPAETDFLYYRVSASTGQHCFARTLAQHNRCGA